MRSRPLFLLMMMLGLSLWHCETDRGRDVRDYYFPLRQLEEGLVYEYRAVGRDSLSPDYWYYRSLPTDSAYYFAKTFYQNDFLPQQMAREEMVDNGMLLADLFLFDTDSTGLQRQIRAEVLSPSVFPFYVRDGSMIYLYKVRFAYPDEPHVSHTFILNRRYQGDTTFHWQGDTYEAIRFGTRGVLEIRDTLEGGMEPTFEGEEIYARGLGLVAYSRSFGGTNLAYVLHDRYPMPELVDQAEAALGR